MITNTTRHAIDAATTVGVVSLTVADLERSLTFYQQNLGFQVLERNGCNATLGTKGAPLLLLAERRQAAPWPHDQYGYTGLYHFAILLPSRTDLGLWLRHWVAAGNPFPGQADHLVSEAFYLSDPDGNGIEVYRDRPRNEWSWSNGQVQMATDPIDIENLLAEADQSGRSWHGLPWGTRLGHVHLQVSDIAQATAFYHGVLGFDIVAEMPTALFISAGGYHHHLGMNTWHSKGASPVPEGVAGLRFFTIELASEEARQDVLARLAQANIPYEQTNEGILVRDPSRHTLILRLQEPSVR